MSTRQPLATAGRFARPNAHRLRIAIIAPPWITVPPPGYGGIEEVVALLCRALDSRGHALTLFAAPGSTSRAEVRSLLDDAHPEAIGASLYEADHVAGAWDDIERIGLAGTPFDVVHDHSGFTAVAMASRMAVPVVHTIHGPLDRHVSAFYQRHGHKVRLVTISHSQARSAPPGVHIDAVVPNPIDVEQWPLTTDRADHVLWVGRMDPVKGPHHAIAAARLARRPILLAGPVQNAHQAGYFQQQVAPHIDGDRVRYLGEVTGAAKRRIYAGARALLMPIEWEEPFGMVMVEALASGTPVIAFPRGAATEIVIPGVNGALAEDAAEMAAAIGRISAIDPRDCRESVRFRYSAPRVAAAYEAVYLRAVRRHRAEATRPGVVQAAHTRR